MWIPGSYDAELNLAFFGPAQTYDTGPLRNSIGAPGVTNESLYTDSTMALDPDTGKLAWHPASEQRPVGFRLGVRTSAHQAAAVRTEPHRVRDRRQAMDRELPSRTGRRHAVNAGDPG